MIAAGLPVVMERLSSLAWVDPGAELKTWVGSSGELGTWMPSERGWTA